MNRRKQIKKKNLYLGPQRSTLIPFHVIIMGFYLPPALTCLSLLFRPQAMVIMRFIQLRILWTSSTQRGRSLTPPLTPSTSQVLRCCSGLIMPFIPSFILTLYHKCISSGFFPHPQVHRTKCSHVVSHYSLNI